ncbi:diguanylate cyclase domain-containing protein [Paenibacillus pabuli]|uniref:diguanylate cyclase domain-containing protein n=1 Tax=Paenibacillus pabuli TaxID=1472 RepID=UPI001FFFEEEE|nr:diguanylate cyclase [Paenibacillus pabuli]
MLTTYFQPILNLQSGNCLGYEILNRPPVSNLFPNAESFYQFIGHTDQVFTFERFCREISIERFRDSLTTERYPDNTVVFLNIHPQVLADSTYRSGETISLLNSYGLSPEQVVFELTEKQAVHDYIEFERILSNYRSQGFKSNPNLEGVAVMGKQGVSLMMRARFFQQIGTQYGYNLYMGRPVELVMNARALVVDYAEQITDVSVLAINRSEEELYDLVLITADDVLYGAVSIRRLLLAVADVRAEMAIFMNLLTGLPGNRIIDERLYQLLQLDDFSVLYIDLDHFKSYNDSYGFKMGDHLIQANC